LGFSVDSIQDIDGDGLNDVVVGGPTWYRSGYGPQCGRVQAFSSATGAVLLEIDGAWPNGWFGFGVEGLDDLDGDGYPEILISTQMNRVYVCSSKDGSVLRYHDGEGTDDVFGEKTARLRDCDGDGISDYVIHAELSWLGQFSKGKVYVYSGKDGALLQSWQGTVSQEYLGIGLADAGDLDGDGLSEILCGDNDGNGHVRALSVKSGAELFRVEGEDLYEGFGQFIASVGDMNRDGYPEFITSALYDDHDGSSAGRVTLFSGKTLRPLYRYYPGYAHAAFGMRLAAGGDWNRDGIPDIVVSALGILNKPPKGGRVSILAGNDLFLQAEPTDPAVGTQTTIEIRGGEPGAVALLALTDVSGTPLFLPLVVDLLDANGELSVQADVPASASGLQCSLMGYAQRLSGRPRLVDTSPATISVQ
jgi:hypothetical protein